MPLRPHAKLFLTVMALMAMVCLGVAFLHWHSGDSVQFFCYLLVALLASALKVTLPGIDGTMSVNFLFILLGVMEMSYAETLVMGAAAVIVQCYWRPTKKLQSIHVIFNLSQLTVATTAAYSIYHYGLLNVFHGRQPLALIAAAIAYFLFNTIAMSLVIALTEQKQPRRVW